MNKRAGHLFSPNPLNLLRRPPRHPALRSSGPSARENARPAYPAPSASGLEPLPGETLAKWKQHPPEIPEAAAEFHEDLELHSDSSTPEMFELLHPDELHEVQQTAGLSEDEAATLAEHVAEAQSEEAAREAQERSFAAADDAAAGPEVETEATESEAAETEEEHELEEEEADAEAEGMIAPPDQTEHDESEHPDDAMAAEAEIAAAEDAAFAPGNSSENSPESQTAAADAGPRAQRFSFPHA